MNYLKTFKLFESFISNQVEKKVIMNMFICEYSSPYWIQSVEILRTIDFPTSVRTSGAGHKGLGKQVLLDINLEESKQFAEKLLTMFPETPLIVLAEVDIRMEDHEHIGYWYQDCLVEPGRWFDELVRKGKRGLFIHDKSMPKVVKENFQVFETKVYSGCVLTKQFSKDIAEDVQTMKDILQDIQDIDEVPVHIPTKPTYDYKIIIMINKDNWYQGVEPYRTFKLSPTIHESLLRLKNLFSSEYYVKFSIMMDTIGPSDWEDLYVRENGLFIHDSKNVDNIEVFRLLISIE
jgi:hypothetical protein